ncbi:hypothetical protein [Moritella sp. F3]|uniref:hypothetical protein n=1 Tax=Moritella sp. F3 TaxID=2718882 RepID=UPI0018E1361E|nr:hypothetical protein [Moritella sp. F3]
MEFIEIPITLNAIRIDGNKLTASVIDQFQIKSLFDYIAKHQIADFNFDSYKVSSICRISSLPILKRYRTHLSSLHDKETVARLMRRFSSCREFGMWSIEGEIFLHPIGADSYYKYDNSWDETLEEFNSLFKNIPKAIYGI